MLNFFSSAKARIESIVRGFSAGCEFADNEDAAFEAASSGRLPVLYIEGTSNYLKPAAITGYCSADEDGSTTEKEYDLCELLPASVWINIVLMSDDIPKLASAEEELISNLKDGTEFAFPGHSQTFICRFKVNNGGRFEHKKASCAGKELFCASLKLCCDSVPIEFETPNPTLTAFDRDVQKRVLRRLSAMIAWAEYYYDKLPYAVTVEKKKDEPLSSEQSDAYEKYNAIKCSAERLREATNIVPEKYLDGFYLDNLLNLMESNDQDVSDAIKTIEQNNADYSAQRKKIIDEKKKGKKEEEKKRRQSADKKARESGMYNSCGDRVINVYTDAVRENVNQWLGLESIASVYGGSTYSAFLRDYDAKTIRFPSVIFRARANFSFNITTFAVYSEGMQRICYCGPEYYPLDYGFDMVILSPVSDEAERLCREALDFFSLARGIELPSAVIPGCSTLLNIELKSGNPVERSLIDHDSLGTVYKRVISFKQFPNVYPIVDYSGEEVKYNQRLQFRLVQQAQFALLASVMAKNDAIGSLENDYRPLVMGTAPSFQPFKSAEYKAVKSAMAAGMYIYRDKFNAAFPKIIKVYPMMYDRMQAGCTVDEMRDEIMRISAEYEARWKNLCDMLDIPLKFMIEVRPSIANNPRDNACLMNYINKMNQSTTFIDAAVKACESEIVSKELEAQREDQLRELEAEEKAEYYSSQPSDAGGGGRGESFLGSVVKTAAGVYIGNKISQPKKNAKKDLFGTAACQRMRKNSMQTCTGCPARDRCTKEY